MGQQYFRENRLPFPTLRDPRYLLVFHLLTHALAKTYS